MKKARNVLELSPERAAEWEEKDDRVVVLRPRPRRGAFDWLPYLLAPKRLRLDELGTLCWRHIDGRRTAFEIATLVRREFGAAAEPAEERVGKFLLQLQREELVRFPSLEPGGPS